MTLDLSGKNILVTGGTGYIAGEIIDQLLELVPVPTSQM